LVSHSSEHIDSERLSRPARRGHRPRPERLRVGGVACTKPAPIVEIIARGHLLWTPTAEARLLAPRHCCSLLGDKLIPPSQVGPFPYSWLNETSFKASRLLSGIRWITPGASFSQPVGEGADLRRRDQFVAEQRERRPAAQGAALLRVGVPQQMAAQR